MVSTTGATILRAAFFTGARFGLALAIVRFAAFAAFALRALPRVAEFPLRGLACFCTFDRFLRLAMITTDKQRDDSQIFQDGHFHLRMLGAHSTRTWQ